MKIRTFRKGGLILKEMKLTANNDIIKANMPELVRIPMLQHAGEPARLLVKTGDVVEEGQLIGEASGIISANVHASVSGRIKSIEKNGTVEIETGGIIKNWYKERRDYNNMPPKEMLEEIKKAGIVGLGGAAFPTHIKLSPPEDKKIKLIIINGAECEPYLTSGHRVMLEKTSEIIDGIRIIKKILSCDKAAIAIENNKPDAVESFRKILNGDEPIRLEILKTIYPQGSEKQLIQAVTGMEVPDGGLPVDMGIITINISTVFAVYEAIVYKKPLIERIITFTGEKFEGMGNYKVRIGTPVKQLFDDFKVPEEHGTIVSGDPMTGFEIDDLNLPIVKNTSGIIVLPKIKDYKVRNRPCIRCSRCLKVCPARLQPSELARLCDDILAEGPVSSQGSNSLPWLRDTLVKMGLFACIECGCCAYVCPSTIPIVGLIRYGKKLLKKDERIKQEI